MMCPVACARMYPNRGPLLLHTVPLGIATILSVSSADYTAFIAVIPTSWLRKGM